MMRREKINKAWRRSVFISLVRRDMMYGFFVAPRCEYIRTMKLKVIHGLRGKTVSIENALNCKAD